MTRQADAFARAVWVGVSALARRVARSSSRVVRALCWWLCQPVRWLVGFCLIAGVLCWIAGLAVWLVLLDMMHDVTGRVDAR